MEEEEEEGKESEEEVGMSGEFVRSLVGDGDASVWRIEESVTNGGTVDFTTDARKERREIFVKVVVFECMRIMNALIITCQNANL